MHVCATAGGGTEAVTGSSECVRVRTECTAEHQNTDRLGRRLWLTFYFQKSEMVEAADARGWI